MMLQQQEKEAMVSQTFNQTFFISSWSSYLTTLSSLCLGWPSLLLFGQPRHREEIEKGNQMAAPRFHRAAI